MPENDPFEPLDNFPEGLHVNALPASEVRRRGDRMRRRNTALATVGGVVAAAVFIGVPVALMSDNDKDTVDPAPQPTPTVTEDAQPDWLTEVPEEFPLADGFPETNGSDGSPTVVVHVDPDDGSIPTMYSSVCGVDWPAAPALDRATISYLGESEDFSDRALLLYQDDEEGAAVLEKLRTDIQDCPAEPTEGGDSVFENRLVDLDLGTEDSVVLTRQVIEDDGLQSQLLVTMVGRSGNALYVEQSYGSAGGQQVIDFQTQRLRERSARPLEAMCLFSAEPCAVATDQAEEPAPPAPSSDSAAGPAIPADFPLAADFSTDGDAEVVGPAADTEAAPPIDLCGTPAWEPAGVVGRLAVRRSGPEFLVTRELVTLSSADEAIAAVQGVRDAVAACAETPGDTADNDQRNQVLEGETGYDSFTWGFTYRTGLGGGTFQLTRVGNAVLVLFSAGEMSPSSLQPTADGLTEQTRTIAPQMCLFTEDGC